MRTSFSMCALAVASLSAATLGEGIGATVLINEVEADTAGSDVLEFIELYDGGVGNTALDGLVIVLVNGSDDLSYDAFDLDGQSTDANGFFVLGNTLVANVDQVMPDGSMQNGADGVALLVGDATDYPVDTAIVTANLVDAMVYDTNDSDDVDLIALLTPGQPQVNEGGGAGGSAADSSQRCPDGSGGAFVTTTYLQASPTPGAPNNCSQPTGACCDTAAGTCTDAVIEVDCLGADDVWTEGVACERLDPPCIATPTGACCNDISGICTDGVEEADCLASGNVYGGDDSTCARIPCEGLEPDVLLISEVVDATLPGGQPKFVEVTNCDTVTVDLSVYSIGNYNNGGTTLGGGASTALSGMLAPGESYVYAYSADTDMTFETTYGVPPDQFAGGGFINGDDAIALFLGVGNGDGSDAILIDVYGVIGEDGTGMPWEHTDGYSNRIPGMGPNATFDIAEWNVGGADSLQDPGGDDVVELALILANTTPFVHACSNCPEDLDGNGDVGFTDLTQLLAAWGNPGGPEDLDGNGDVGFTDLTAILVAWGPCP